MISLSIFLSKWFLIGSYFFAFQMRLSFHASLFMSLHLLLRYSISTMASDVAESCLQHDHQASPLILIILSLIKYIFMELFILYRSDLKANLLTEVPNHTSE